MICCKALIRTSKGRMCMVSSSKVVCAARAGPSNHESKMVNAKGSVSAAVEHLRSD